MGEKGVERAQSDTLTSSKPIPSLWMAGRGEYWLFRFSRRGRGNGRRLQKGKNKRACRARESSALCRMRGAESKKRGLINFQDFSLVGLASIGQDPSGSNGSWVPIPGIPSGRKEAGVVPGVSEVSDWCLALLPPSIQPLGLNTTLSPHNPPPL